MPIVTDGPMMAPERGIHELSADFGSSIGATASEAWADSPLSQLSGGREIAQAANRPDPLSTPSYDQYGLPASNGVAVSEDVKPAVPRMDMIEALDRVKKAGLEKHLTLPNQPDMPPAQLDIMIQHAQKRRENEATIERGPQGFIPSALQVGTSFLVGAVDPINVASAFIPVMGELRYGKLLASAGDSAAGRLAIRAGVGGAQGAVGQAALEPLDWWSHTQEGRDFGMADVLHNLMFGAALGGGLHAGGGFISDAYRGAKGRALYPFGPGEPMENVNGTHLPASLLHEDGVGADALHEHLGDYLQRPDATESVPGEIVDEAPQRYRGAVNLKFEEEIPFPDPVSHTISTGHRYAMLDDKGDRLGVVDIEPTDGGKNLEVVWVGHEHGSANRLDLGASSMRSVLQQVKEHYPEAETLTGQRISGAHTAGTQDVKIQLRSPVAAPSAAVQIINDLPPRAHEDAMRGAIANLIDGDAVRSGDMLEAAAQTDPRIAESFDTPRAVEASQPRGRAAADPQTWSLYEFLAREGGLKPDQELSAIFGNAKGPFVPGFGPLVRQSGRTLDDALRLAKDHGYLFDPADVTGAEGKVAIRDLLDKVAEQNAGRKQYRNDQQHASKADDAAALEREKHEIVSALHDEIEASTGQKGVKVDPALEDRVVQIVMKEGEHDVLAAYERAIMEDAERFEGLANGRRNNAETAHIPGWDAPDAGAASRSGQAGEGQRGQTGLPGEGAGRADGGQPRNAGQGDRSALPAQLDKAAAWRGLAHTTPDFNTPDIIAKSNEAAKVKPPSTKLDERVAAAAKADAYAQQMYDMFAHRLPEEDRIKLQEHLADLDRRTADNDVVSQRGAACLFEGGV